MHFYTNFTECKTKDFKGTFCILLTSYFTKKLMNYLTVYCANVYKKVLDRVKFYFLVEKKIAFDHTRN